MIERDAKVVNQLGLHARPAAQLVRLAATFTSELEIERDGETVNAKSILGVMTLAAECGSTLKVRADGDDAERAAQAIVELIETGFGEA